MVKLIGHRGCKNEEPENTLLGIKKAIENNVDGVEIDVHLTKDNKLVVIHDDMLDRTTNGKGKVSEFLLKDIQKLDAGKGEKVPTLDEVLFLVKNLGVEIFVEIKCAHTEKAVVDAIVKNKMIGRTTVKSFDHKVVKNVKDIDKRIKTACLIVGLPVHVYKIIEDAHADMISVNVNYVDKELIEECHSHGYKVFIWNIDEPQIVRKYIDMGVDYIGTNTPSKVRI